MEFCLETENLCKSYKDFQALDHLSMHVPKGSIYGFIGKNGAGKTTLIRIICGLQLPTDGEYQLYGIAHSDKKLLKVRKRMGAVVETSALYPEMSAWENLEQQYRILGIPSFDEIGELLELVGLSGTGKKKARNFSLGMRQRLGIAVALAGHPDFLVLDEPMNGLDPQGMIEIRELILKLNRDMNITVLISSHILDELSKLATHFGVLDHGRMVAEVSAEELNRSCRKCMRLRVSDITILSRVLERMGAEYCINSEEEADIYSEINITDMTLALAKENCEVLRITEHGENLESYFMNLVGGSL